MRGRLQAEPRRQWQTEQDSASISTAKGQGRSDKPITANGLCFYKPCEYSTVAPVVEKAGDDGDDGGDGSDGGGWRSITATITITISSSHTHAPSSAQPPADSN